MAEAWCLKCRVKKEIKSPKTVTMKNGNRGIRGVCPVCNTNVFRVVGKA